LTIALSTIVPARDARPTIAACLEALAAEGLDRAPDAEVIVVDDASTDGTAELVAGRFPWVRVVRLERNLGADGARNAGVAVARGARVAFIDADCAVLPGWAAAVRDGARSGAPIVMGRVVPPPRLLARVLAVLEHGEFLAAPAAGLANFATLNVALDGALARARPFEERLRTCGDRALSWELHRAGHAIRFEPAQAVLHAPPLGLLGVLARRRRYVDALLALRRRDPTLPGARLLALGAAATPLVVAGRIARDLRRLARAREELVVSRAALPLHALALVALRALDGAYLLARFVDGAFVPGSRGSASPARTPAP
jgi:glycosyltransferase involved in cell wall biosynthesis